MSSNLMQWIMPWEPSVTLVIATLLAAVFYARGVSVAAKNPAMLTRPSTARQSSFWLGLGLFYMMCHTGFDYYAEHAFFMHRLQHSILHHMAPFLMALSRPGAMLLAGMPPRMRRGLHSLNQSQMVRAWVTILNQPFIAVMLFCGLILFWLLPSVHFIAMLDWRLYRIMNWSMALDGLMFWNLVLNNFSLKRTSLSPTTRIVMMLAIIPPQIVMGAILFTAPHEIYSIYSICGRVFPAMSALADQQVGALILWVSAAMMSVIGMLIVMQREWIGGR